MASTPIAGPNQPKPQSGPPTPFPVGPNQTTGTSTTRQAPAWMQQPAPKGIAGRNTSGATEGAAPSFPKPKPAWATVTPPPTPYSPHVEAMQRFLASKGYKVPKNGFLDHSTTAAAADWRAKAHATAVSKASAAKTTPAKAPDTTSAVPKAGSGTGDTAPPKNTGGKRVAAGGSKGAGAGGTGNATLAALLANLNPNTGTMIDPQAYGNAIAGAQFDPSIYQDRIDLSRAPLQAKQDLADISNWYGQALQSMIGAGTSDATQNQAEQGSMGDAVAKIISSLGGSANQGSGLVGAAGADQVGNLAALGSIDQSFHNDMNPLMRAEAASALTNQKNLDVNHQTDLQHQLASDLGARGQTEAADAYSALGQNNQLAQQRFGNRFGIMQAIESAQIAGENAQAKQAAAQTTAKIDTAKANAYIDHINAQDSHMAAQDAYTKWKEAHPTSKPTGFAALIAKGKGASISDAIAKQFTYTQSDVTNGVVGADQVGKTRPDYFYPNGQPNIPKVVHDLNQQIRNLGYDSKDPAARQYRDMMLKKVFGITPKKSWEYNW